MKLWILTMVWWEQMRQEITSLNTNTFEQSDHLRLLDTACRITIRSQLDFYSSRTRSNTHSNWFSSPSSSYKRVNTSCSRSWKETYDGWVNTGWGNPNTEIWTGDTNATWEEGQLDNVRERWHWKLTRNEIQAQLGGAIRSGEIQKGGPRCGRLAQVSCQGRLYR